jgi:signal peptidase I
MNINFELFLFYLTLITGVISLFDILFLAPRRKRYATDVGVPVKMPLVIDYARSFFPVLLLVFLLRSFLFEPFSIPSGSLEPTLLTGDFILVNKFNYGIRLPIVHKKILNYNEPKRGDILIFRWPPDPSYNFIKRVIGLPGDKISYINKEIYVNGEKVPQSDLQKGIPNLDADEGWQALMKEEDLLGVKHKILVQPGKNSRNYFDIIVPEGMYYVMGDNRDDSADSRYWGFVPSENVVGKAVMVWMSWNNHDYKVRWRRIGSIIH